MAIARKRRANANVGVMHTFSGHMHTQGGSCQVFACVQVSPTGKFCRGRVHSLQLRVKFLLNCGIADIRLGNPCLIGRRRRVQPIYLQALAV